METLKKYHVSLLLGSMIIFGFFLRSFDIGADSLWIDEGFTLSQVSAIRDHAYPLLPSGKTEWKDPLLPYLLSLIPGDIHENIAAFRMVSVVFATASILLIYLVGKNFFGSSVGLISSFFLTFSYWHIAWSRQIRSYSLLVFLILCTLLTLALYDKTKRQHFLGGTIVFSTLCILAKISGALLIPGMLFFLIRDKKILWGTLSMLIGSLFVILYASSLGRGVGLSSVHYSTYYSLEYFWKGFGIILVFAILGTYLVWREKDLRTNILLLSLFIIPFLFFSFFVYVGQKRYLFFVTPILFLYAAYFTHAFREPFTKKHLAAFLLLASIVTADRFTTRSFLFFPQSHFALEAYTPQPNFREAYAALEEDAKNENVTAVISAYPFMDCIYSANADYAIAISYTGKSSDLSMTENHREYYSGTPEIRSINRIRQMNEDRTIYIVVDEMALSRMHPSMARFIQRDMQLLFEDVSIPGSTIFIYKAAIESLPTSTPP